ncbi:hypothetical protein D3C73_703010 [compost metagenome]
MRLIGSRYFASITDNRADFDNRRLGLILLSCFDRFCNLRNIVAVFYSQILPVGGFCSFLHVLSEGKIKFSIQRDVVRIVQYN